MATPYPRPDHLKIMTGEKNKDRFIGEVSTAEELKEVPSVPDWWTDDAKEIFIKKCKLLIAHNMLMALDISYIEQMCLIEAKLNEIWRNGEIPPGHLVSSHNTMKAQSGMNFISRIKNPIQNGKKEKKNKFAKGVK